MVCRKSTKYSNRKPTGKMESNFDAKEPWDMICVDWIGPINPPTRDYKYILVVVDYYTRWVEAFPTKHNSSTDIC